MVVVAGIGGMRSADHPLVDVLADAGVGGVMLRDDNLADVDQARALVEGLRERLGPDLLVAVDEEGGRVSAMEALGADIPSARRLGRAGPEAAYAAGVEVGATAASVGIDWILSPVADLDDGPAQGVIGDRSFGADPGAVTAGVTAFAAGLRDAGVAGTAKHFPGYAGAADTHGTPADSRATMTELVQSHLRPFDALVDDGVAAVMTGHVAYPEVWGSLPASLEPGAYRLLRSRGFEGVAVTDSLGMGAIHSRWGFADAAVLAIGAGADAVLVTQGDRAVEIRDALMAAVEDGRLDERRLVEASRRVGELAGLDGRALSCQPAPPPHRSPGIEDAGTQLQASPPARYGRGAAG